MTANPTPLPPEGVTQEDIDLANDYLSSAFRCTATLAERFAKARIAATSAAEGDVEALKAEIEEYRRRNFTGLANAAITTARAARDEAEAKNARFQWQSIETAPKDGTTIDVWIEGEFSGRRTDVSWRQPSDSEWWVHGGDTIETPDATWHDAFGPLGKSEPPTHWMPQPQSPTRQALDQGAEG